MSANIVCIYENCNIQHDCQKRASVVIISIKAEVTALLSNAECKNVIEQVIGYILFLAITTLLYIAWKDL